MSAPTSDEALSALRAVVNELRAVVNEQAEEEGLWLHTERIEEAFLQQELRRLHAAVENYLRLLGATP